MKTAACNARAFEPFRRVVVGPCSPDDLHVAEQFARAFVLHDHIRMLPESFRITIGENDQLNGLSPLLVKSEGFETFGDYFDPSFVETPHGRELLRSTVRIEPDGKTFFDPFGVSVILALEQIRVGGSAVVSDSTWQIEVVRTVERTIEERRDSAEWESRLGLAEQYPDHLFNQLDESWQLLAKKLARGNLDLRVPPVLGIVMTRSARRDAIPAVLLDLRNEWADARNKLWQRIDALNDARTIEEEEDLVRELEEASKLFSRQQTEYDTQPMRVFWDIAAATGAAVSTGGPAGAAVVGATARSLPKMLQDIGPALFGRGAFDLAKRVRREVSKIDPNVLKRFLSASEQKLFG
ncbi:MAG TPA: hypothetical protein VMH05_09690, partial [Bryobacteraceae bacterium]|nr:hypothetical protein [Bryobacteraceae bacterium]